MMQVSSDLVHSSIGSQVPSYGEPQSNQTGDSMLVGLTRVFRGELRVGLRVFLLSARYSPAKLLRAASERGLALDWTALTPEWVDRAQRLGNSNEAGAVAVDVDRTQQPRDSLEQLLAKLVRKRHVQVCVVRALYLLVGRELNRVERLCAGAIGAVGGLEEHVYKCGTLATSLECPPLFATGSSAEFSLASFSNDDPDLVCVRATTNEFAAAGAAGVAGAPVGGGVDDEKYLSEADLAILQVGLQPARLADMQTLLDGLDQLVRADPAARVRHDEQGIDS